MNLIDQIRAREDFKNGAIEGKKVRAICMSCGNASGHFFVSEHGKTVLRRCEYCYDVYALPAISSTLTAAAIDAWQARPVAN